MSVVTLSYSEQELKSWFDTKSHKEIARDMKTCMNLKREQKYLKYDNVFSYFVSSKQAECKVDSNVKKTKRYCSFIVSITFATLNIFPFTKVMKNISLQYMIILASNKYVGLAFQITLLRFLFKGDKMSNGLPEKSFKTFLLNNIVELHDMLNLKGFWKNKNQRLDCSKTGFTDLKIRLKILSENKCFVGKSKCFERFIYYIVDLYREFQVKTLVEIKEDYLAFTLFLEVLEHTFLVFKYQRVEIVSKLIKYWPTCYKYQCPVIKVFMKFCKELNTDEQKAVEKLVVKKFDDLFLNSQCELFQVACSESKELSKSFVGFINVMGEKNDIYQCNLSKAALNKKGIVGKKKRRENIVKFANGKQNSKRRRLF